MSHPRAAVVLALSAMTAACSLPPRAIYPAGPPEPVPAVARGALVNERATDGSPIVAIYVPPPEGAPVVVYFHGNGMQLADTASFVDLLSRRGVGVLAVEFPGYGLCPGIPSESSIYASGEAAIEWLGTAHHIGADRVVLAGYSIGTGAAVELARRGRGRALVLLSPIPSIPELGRRILPILPASFFPDVYANTAKAPDVHVPVLLVHGTEDDVTPPDTSLHLQEQFPCAVTLWALGANHRIFRGHAEELADWVVAFSTLDRGCQK